MRQGSHTARQLIARGEVPGRYGAMPNPAVPKNDDGDPQFANVLDLAMVGVIHSVRDLIA